MKKIAILVVLISSFMVFESFGAEKLEVHKLFSDNMVLQRDRKVPVWGTATPGEEITVSISIEEETTKADKDGNWQVLLYPAAASGPFKLRISGKKEKIVFNNVMYGDVWVCSGQSNMGWTVRGSNNPAEEIANANYPNIRLFKVKNWVAHEPQTELTGEWQVCSPKTVPSFSGVGYFFGRDLFKKIKIPIGLIQSAWGGTPAESWTPRPALESSEMTKPILARYKRAVDNYPKRLEKYNEKLAAHEKSLETFYHQDTGDEGLKKGWEKADFNDSDWKKMSLPRYWESIMNIDGAVWFRKKVTIPDSLKDQDLTLDLGAIDDYDNTYFNGVKIGATGKETSSPWKQVRKYTVPAKLVKAGPATIAIRVFDRFGGGGFAGKSTSFELESKKSPKQNISLKGPWSYKVELKLKPHTTKPPRGPRSPYGGPKHPHTPASLYNAMIHPMVKFPIKGAIWYQGESNSGRAFQYRDLMKMMITQWREKWNQGDFPFLIVELANYTAKKDTPSESNWAELREAQNMAMELPKVGVASAIDIGEAKDIHPRNKQDVGKRLALSARKIAYGEDIVHSGPTFKSSTKEGNKIRLKFENVGTGLQAKNGKLKHFAIAAEDKKFVWANAEIDGDTVLVWSEEVRDPVAVRYAWANNPETANLYNKENLPATPFRTDQWPGITFEKR